MEICAESNRFRALNVKYLEKIVLKINETEQKESKESEFLFDLLGFFIGEWILGNLEPAERQKQKWPGE